MNDFSISLIDSVVFSLLMLDWRGIRNGSSFRVMSVLPYSLAWVWKEKKRKFALIISRVDENAEE